MQISTSVQQTMEDVMLMPTALTMTAASCVPVYLDTLEMDSTVQVNVDHREKSCQNAAAV